FRALLHAQIAEAGYRSRGAASADEALAMLEQDRSIGLVLSDVRMPGPADGIGLIRAIRRRWPELPLAAITGYPDDLAELFGTPECPVMILAKPFQSRQLDEALRLALVGPPRRMGRAGLTAGRSG